MNNIEPLSNITIKYLNTFNSILENMIKEMTKAPLTNSISHNFIVQMIPHHKAAIEMSKNILKYTTNISVQNIAIQIIDEQTKSIANLKRALTNCEKLNNPEQNVYYYQNKINQIMQIMFRRMASSPITNKINVDFIEEMIPHHEGAIAMVETILQYDICSDLKPILNAIITSQKKGVMQMKYILQSMGY